MSNNPPVDSRPRTPVRPRRTRPDGYPTRLPPHSPEAEQGVLGCILLSPTDCLPECVETFKGSSDHFYDLRHRVIFEAMLKVAEQNRTVDLILLTQQLKDHGHLEEVGGNAYLAEISDASPSAANVAYYAGILKDKRLLRRVLQVCGEASQWVFDNPDEVGGLLDRVERSVLEINQDRLGVTEIQMKEVMRRAQAKIQDLFEREGKLSGLASGYPALDRKTDGFHGGEMIVIAARPSVGKTALAMNIADHIAVDQNVPVGVFSLEMSAEVLGP